ncbi:hypothetical protein [uncultured Tenacibaculum sp.]|uniref:hypothetical protein n=1 Tax=uncultured Tenacibaculum sp. TaxID=174713 RepID=UPI00261F6062|nr:hypothetical protein [uncultured Tenacibaculum sp.]
MNRYYVLLIGILLSSCGTQSFDTKEEMWSYLRDADHGYLQEKNVNNYDFSLLYKPTDLLVLQELGELKDQEKVTVLREKYSKYLYFTLSMSRNNKELLSTTPRNRQEFGRMVNELAFGMDKKVHVFTQKKDTLALLDYVYPRMYGMSKATTMLFVYPRDQKYLKGEYLNLTIGDLGTYTGEVKFKIPTKLLKNEPKLNFK